MINIRNLQAEELFRDFRQAKWEPSGKVSNVVGKMIEAVMPESAVGTVVDICLGRQEKSILGEIVGFRNGKVLILPFDDILGINIGAKVSPRKIYDQIPVGDQYLGKVIDPFGNPIDGLGVDKIRSSESFSIDRNAPSPMTRKRICEP